MFEKAAQNYIVENMSSRDEKAIRGLLAPLANSDSSLTSGIPLGNIGGVQITLGYNETVDDAVKRIDRLLGLGNLGRHLHDFRNTESGTELILNGGADMRLLLNDLIKFSKNDSLEDKGDIRFSFNNNTFTYRSSHENEDDFWNDNGGKPTWW